MNIDNQTNYWDSVAQQKIFTHPVNINLLLEFIDKSSVIIDYGCGYGRIVNELLAEGFLDVSGYDTSVELINRGKTNDLPIYHIVDPSGLPTNDGTADGILLFAVLTCIPSNCGQAGLIKLLHSKLKPGGILYISDYYLQENEVSKSRYTNLNDDEHNFGVFTIPEGATLRHHTRDWIAGLIHDFNLKYENIIELKTMNGNSASAFQMILQKK